jgi:glycosyltransferase involved in cell wall biosynthesis
MKIFLAGTSFLPAYGGPARSVSRLAMALAAQGAEVGLWSQDQSVLETPFLGPQTPVRRLGGSAGSALAAFGRPEVLHDNGLWLAHNHQLAAISRSHGIPRMVSLRGMLEPWALKHKYWKKRLAWALYQKRDLQRATAIHVTAASEQASAVGLGLTNRLVLVPNGVDWVGTEPAAVPERPRNPVKDGRRQALFLGRIHPVKGLPMLVEAWAKARPHGWNMVVAGPDEGGHLAEVKAMVASKGLDGVFSFPGELAGTAKSEALRTSDLFILPSHTENFGMAAGEALAHGIPVLTTQGTPWESLINWQAGWWVPISAEGIEAALTEAAHLPASELAAMGQRGQSGVREQFDWNALAGRMMKAYAWCRDEGPGCHRSANPGSARS